MVLSDIYCSSEIAGTSTSATTGDDDGARGGDKGGGRGGDDDGASGGATAATTCASSDADYDYEYSLESDFTLFLSIVEADTAISVKVCCWLSDYWGVRERFGGGGFMQQKVLWSDRGWRELRED